MKAYRKKRRPASEAKQASPHSPSQLELLRTEENSRMAWEMFTDRFHASFVN